VSKRVLVVGGTGMLKGVSLGLVEQGYQVSVLARTPSRLNALVAKSDGAIEPLIVNYCDAEALKLKLKQYVQQKGLFDIAVVWVHSTAREASFEVSKWVGSIAQPGHYFHVLGSAAADPSNTNMERLKWSALASTFTYYEIVLGFQVEENHSRWLMHKEISNGVLEAIEAKQERFVVGQVEPWSMCP